MLAGREAGDVGVVDQQHGGKILGIADEADERAGLDERTAILLVEQIAAPGGQPAVLRFACRRCWEPG